MNPAEECYARLLEAQQRVIPQHVRDELDKQEAAEREQHRIRRRLPNSSIY